VKIRTLAIAREEIREASVIPASSLREFVFRHMAACRGARRDARLPMFAIRQRWRMSCRGSRIGY
jgi:hypothetical protein